MYRIFIILFCFNALFAGNDSLKCIFTFTPSDSSSWGAKCDGDFNGDGSKDFIILAKEGQFFNSHVYIYYGGAQFDTIPDVVIKKPDYSASGWAFSSFGYNTILTGDFNGDDCTDLVLSDPNASNYNYGLKMGMVFVYFGGATPDTLPGLNGAGSAMGLHLGEYLTVGDFNGDGFSDLGMAGDGPDYYATGTVRIYYGRSDLGSGIQWPMGWTKTGQPLEFIGQELTSADFNGDGCDELLYLQSADQENNYHKNLLIYGGSPNGLSEQPVFNFFQMNNIYCNNINPICDFNNDGNDDLFVYSAFVDNSQSLFTYSGNQTTFLSLFQQTYPISLGIRLKINNDGFPDYINRIGAYSPTENNNVYRTIYGNSNFALTVQDTLHFMYNNSICPIGDINNDGFTEFISKEFNGKRFAICSTEHVTVGIDETEAMPKQVELTSYPNPFNNTTKIKYDLPAANRVNLAIYNAKGELVKQLINARQDKGAYSIDFNASGLNSGVYFVKLSGEKMNVNRKVLLIK